MKGAWAISEVQSGCFLHATLRRKLHPRGQERAGRSRGSGPVPSGPWSWLGVTGKLAAPSKGTTQLHVPLCARELGEGQ